MLASLSSVKTQEQEEQKKKGTKKEENVRKNLQTEIREEGA